MVNTYEDELSRAAVAYVVEPLPDTLEMERWANADALTRHTMCFIAGAAYARKHTSQLGDAYAQLLDDDQLLKLLPFINGAHEWMSGAKTIRDTYEAERKQTHAEITALKAEVERMREADQGQTLVVLKTQAKKMQVVCVETGNTKWVMPLPGVKAGEVLRNVSFKPTTTP